MSLPNPLKWSEGVKKKTKKHKSTKAKINGQELRGENTQLCYSCEENKIKCGFRVCEWDEG